MPDVRLVGPKHSLAHAKICKASDCPECTWAQKGPKWRKKHSWVRGGYDSSGKFGLGCEFCSQAFLKDRGGGGNGQKDSDSVGSYLNFSVTPVMSMKVQSLRRHAESQYHKASVSEITQGQESSVQAPSSEEFLTLLDKMGRGQSCREQSGGTSSKRATLMRFCLSEAILSCYREFLKTATSITIQRDEPGQSSDLCFGNNQIQFSIDTPCCYFVTSASAISAVL